RSRSRMNVVFNLEDETLNEEFLDEAREQKLENLKGHRILGGMRASLYNAVPVEAAEKLAEFMVGFAQRHR
ncbi:MAG: 3-phosphoserine/phosphohydroxythreonine transaminase, partial [Burkholderiales bacterium]|nr:3-phosphoserine/phosphohydroxythreonine transaminase [Burkholderiales bacterium]